MTRLASILCALCVLCGSSFAQTLLEAPGLAALKGRAIAADIFDSINDFHAATNGALLAPDTLASSAYGEPGWFAYNFTYFTNQFTMWQVKSNANLPLVRSIGAGGSIIKETGTNWLFEDFTNHTGTEWVSFLTADEPVVHTPWHIRFVVQFNNVSNNPPTLGDAQSINLDMFGNPGWPILPQLDIPPAGAELPATLLAHGANSSGASENGNTRFLPINHKYYTLDVYIDCLLGTPTANSFAWMKISDATNGAWLDSLMLIRFGTNLSMFGYGFYTGYLNRSNCFGNAYFGAPAFSYHPTTNEAPWVLATPSGLSAVQTGVGEVTLTLPVHNFKLASTVVQYQTNIAPWTIVQTNDPMSYTSNAPVVISGLNTNVYNFGITALTVPGRFSPGTNIISLDVTNWPSPTWVDSVPFADVDSDIFDGGGPVEVSVVAPIGGTCGTVRFAVGSLPFGSAVSKIAVYDADDNLLATANIGSVTASTLQEATLLAPFAVTSGATYKIAMHNGGQWKYGTKSGTSGTSIFDHPLLGSFPTSTLTSPYTTDATVSMGIKIQP